MQVDFHLTFTVDTKLKQNAKTGLVEKYVVWLSSCCSASRIWDFSGVQGWLERFAKLSAFYLVGIAMECVNWCLGSMDFEKCHSSYGKV